MQAVSVILCVTLLLATAWTAPGIQEDHLGRNNHEAQRPEKNSNSHRSNSDRNSGSKNWNWNDKNRNKRYASCSQKNTKVIERDGKQCFSVHPLLQCSGNCSPHGSLNKQVEFVCLQPSSAQHWKDMIKRGANPDFSQMKPTQTFSISVPESCKN